MAKATYLLRKAGELVKDRSYQQAVEVYLQATETDPSDARAWFGLGVCLYKVANLDVAHIALDRALKMGYPRAQDALDRVRAAEQRREAEGKGAKATVAPSEVRKRAKRQPAPSKEPPPRPLERAEEDKIDLDRYVRVMLIENIETDRRAITDAIRGTIKAAEVSAVDYGMSTSDTMSGTVHYDVAVLDWDMAPDAASGLIHILKIKRSTMLVICLTEKWHPETAVEILEAGADYHLVKERHFASAIPLILAQWARRDHAVALDQVAKMQEGAGWPESLNAMGEPLMLIGADLSVQQANQAAMKQFRRGADEFVGRSYSMILYEQGEPPEACPILRALEKGEPADGQFRHDKLGKNLRVRAWPVTTRGTGAGGVIALLHEAGAAEALETREWLYRSLTEKANAGVAMVGPEGKLEYVNQRLCTMMDHIEQELLGQPIEVLVPVQEQESLRETLREAVESGQSGDRLMLQAADGTAFPAEVRTASFATREGLCLVATVIGVTELEEAEQKLWTEARRFALVLDEGIEKLECGVVVLDSEGRVTWANSAGAALFSRDKGALVESQYAALANEELRGRVPGGEEFVDAILDAHRGGAALEGRRLDLGDGDAIAYWSTPVTGGEESAVSRVEHFYHAASSVAEAPLPVGPGAAAGLAAASPDVLFTADVEGKVTWCNSSAGNVIGYGAPEVEGKALAELAAEDGREAVAGLLVQACGREGRPQTTEVRMARADGTPYWAQVKLVSSQDADGAQVVHGSIRDLTDRKVAEAIREIVAGKRPV